jgi:hypothetical protein
MYISTVSGPAMSIMFKDMNIVLRYILIYKHVYTYIPTVVLK